MHIMVDELTKTFRIAQKQPGFRGAIKSFVAPSYETKAAVSGVSFGINEGELVGFIGPNGAGKTTTLKMLSGLLYPTAGTVRVMGYTPFDRQHDFLRKIALVMGQKNQLWWDLPAVDTFLLNKEIYQIPQAQYTETFDELVTLLDVGSVLTTPVRKLSLGQRMKMELIAALIHRPQILFLDEPTIGLDVVMQQNLRDFIAHYNKRYNATILLTSHYMDDVKQLCERVIMIDHGQVMFDGKLANLIAQHTKMKRLTIRLEKKVAREKLAAIGTIVDYTYPTITFDIPRDQVKQVATRLLADFPVEDIDVQEMDIEEVIRDVFATPYEADRSTTK